MCQYARTVGLPDDFGKYELDVMIREEEEAEKDKQTIPREPTYSVPPIRMDGVPPAAETKKWALGVTLLAAVLVVCSIAYALWERYRNPPVEAKSEAAQVQASTPVRQVAPPQTPSENPDSAAQTQPPTDNASGTSGASGTNAATPAGATAGPPAASNPAPVVPAPVAPAKPAQAPGAVHLVLKATENVWVQVTSGEEAGFRRHEGRDFAGILSEEPIRVRLGNASGVQIEYNGTVIPALGPRGMVRSATFRKDGYDVPPPQ